MCWLHVYVLVYVPQFAIGTKELESEYEAAKAQLEENDTYTQVHIQSIIVAVIV